MKNCTKTHLTNLVSKYFAQHNTKELQIEKINALRTIIRTMLLTYKKIVKRDVDILIEILVGEHFISAKNKERIRPLILNEILKHQNELKRRLLLAAERHYTREVGILTNDSYNAKRSVEAVFTVWKEALLNDKYKSIALPTGSLHKEVKEAYNRYDPLTNTSNVEVLAKVRLVLKLSAANRKELKVLNVETYRDAKSKNK